jgi:hypothetical protein
MSSKIDVPKEVLDYFNGRFAISKSGKQFEGIGLPYLIYGEDEKKVYNLKKTVVKKKDRK